MRGEFVIDCKTRDHSCDSIFSCFESLIFTQVVNYSLLSVTGFDKISRSLTCAIF